METVAHTSTNADQPATGSLDPTDQDNSKRKLDDMQENDAEATTESDALKPEENKHSWRGKKQVIQMAIDFNNQIIKSRRLRPPFYYDAHTRNHRVLPSFQIYCEQPFHQQNDNDANIKEQEYVKTSTLHADGLDDITPPQTAFQIFCSHYVEHLKQQEGDIPTIEAQRTASNVWKKLSSNERKHYEDLAMEDKSRYQREIDEYKERVKRNREEIIKQLPSSLIAGKDISDIDVTSVSILPEENFPLDQKMASDVMISVEERLEQRKKNKKCQRCGKQVEQASSLRCSTCFRAFHFDCLELSKEVFDKIISYDASKWKCMDCKQCSICRDQGSEKQLLLCEMCDRGFHIFCLEPPLAKIPPGRWLCADCVECASCGSKKSSSGQWFKDYTLCRSCHTLIKANKHCPVCKKAHKPADTTPMICCDKCELWVHKDCDRYLDDDKYKELSESNAAYICPVCKDQKK